MRARYGQRVIWAYVGCTIVFINLSGTARAERIKFGEPRFVNGGSQVALFALIEDNQTPIAGYTLNIDVFPEDVEVGRIFANAELTTFFTERNLITQGGGQLNPEFSLIIDPRDGGVFINAQELNLMPVQTARAGVNDVLADIRFDILPGTVGIFTISVGPFSTLIDGNLDSIPFEANAFRLVVPEPATWILCGMAFVLVVLRRIRRRIHA